MSTCEHNQGAKVYFMGQEVVPCRFVEIEKHSNVNLTVMRCRVCGAIDFEWERTPETVSQYLEKGSSDD